MSEGSSPCILVLNKVNSGTLTFGGGGSINAKCAILVNSAYNASATNGTVLFSGGASGTVGSLTLRRGTQVYSNSNPSGDPCNFSDQKILNCPYFTTQDPYPNPLSDHNILYTNSYPNATIPGVPTGAATTLPSNSTINGKDYNIGSNQTFNNTTMKNSSISNSHFAVKGLKLSTDMTLNSGATVVIDGPLTVGGVLTLNSVSSLYVTGALSVSKNIIINGGANFYALGGTSIDSGGSLKSVAALPPDKFLIQGGVTIKSKAELNLTGNPSALFYLGSNSATETAADSQIYFQGGTLMLRSGTLALSRMTTFNGSGSGIVIDMESPSSGVWQNVVAFQPDPPAQSATDTLPYNPTTPTSTGFNASGMTVNITGAFVMPYTPMNFSATSTASSKCAFFIVDSFNFQGSPTLGSGCALGQSFSGFGQGLLVE